MSTVTNWEEKYHAFNTLATEYAHAVAHMRDLQCKYPATLFEQDGGKLQAAQAAVDQLTSFWLIPEVPAVPDPLDVLDLPAPPAGVVPPIPERVTSGLDVSGRWLQRPYCEVTVLNNRVMVRIDDEMNPEAWVEVLIGEDLVWEWQRRMAAHDPDEVAELREQFPDGDAD